MMNIVLYQPEIPPNTGNIVRLCQAIGAELHLIRPLGFNLNDKRFRRAQMDYGIETTPHVYDDFQHFLAIHFADTDSKEQNHIQITDRPELLAFSTKVGTCYSKYAYKPNDYLLFGPETRGLPEEILYSESVAAGLTIPMQTGTRSLNLANAVAIVAYEAWRQLGFAKNSTR